MILTHTSSTNYFLLAFQFCNTNVHVFNTSTLQELYTIMYWIIPDVEDFIS